eukprot:m.190384 g.190384  ORF g.190384 m.190384 type:complete len:52 (-) comp15640_c0_seq34:460-615(-)
MVYTLVKQYELSFKLSSNPLCIAEFYVRLGLWIIMSLTQDVTFLTDNLAQN